MSKTPIIDYLHVVSMFGISLLMPHTWQDAFIHSLLWVLLAMLCGSAIGKIWEEWPTWPRWRKFNLCFWLGATAVLGLWQYFTQR